MRTGIVAVVERAAFGLNVAGGIVLLAMMLLTFGDVVGRYVFNRPIVGAVEVTELLMGMLCLLGLAAVTARRDHVEIELLETRLPRAGRKLCELLSLLVGSIFSVLLCWQLWRVALSKLGDGIETPIWALPVHPVAFVMAIASILFVLVLLLQLVRAIVTPSHSQASS